MQTRTVDVVDVAGAPRWDAFRSRFAGPLVRPGDDGYDAARRVWNGSIDRYPGLIARCLSVADVSSALTFAREAGLTIAVRGGGHNVAGFGSCDGGVVIDLSGMQRVRVDAARRTAVVQAGATWAGFDREAQAHERPGERQPGLGVIRSPLEEASESQARFRGAARFEERPAASEVDFRERRIESRRAVVVGKGGRPLAVEPMELAALHVEQCVAGPARDLTGDFRYLIVQVPVRRRPPLPESGQEERERKRPARAPPGKPGASFKRRQTVVRS